MKENFEKIHNDVIDGANKIFQESIDEVTQKVIDNSRNLDIRPINSYVLVKPYTANPYAKINVTESGLAMNTNEHKLFNSDTGEVDEAEMWEVVGSVVEVSPNCKYVQVGDDIFYREMQSIPVNFLGLGLEVVSENQILVVVNDNLKERWKI
jgi:co-chaperonin GroES (HSP10)